MRRRIMERIKKQQKILRIQIMIFEIFSNIATKNRKHQIENEESQAWLQSVFLWRVKEWRTGVSTGTSAA